MPDESAAIPDGRWNWPSPEPEVPHLVRKVPLASNLWIRLLLVSAT